MAARPVVRVTRRLPEAVEQALAERFDARFNSDDTPFTPEQLAAALRDSDAVLCTVTDRFTTQVIAAGVPVRARILANFGVGTNHIAIGAAHDAGVTVTNTPGVLTDDTADLAILLMLAVLRRAGEGERELRAGRWSGWRPTHLMGARLTGKTLGIVGPGRIGSAVARRAHDGFGMRVLAWSRSGRALDPSTGIERVPTLEALLAASDVVSLHCPATPETRHLIDAAALSVMRPHAVLINTARGDVVDEAALVEALRAQRIAGAGLDVYEAEPLVHPGLMDRDDVVLLPHLGSATRESREAMGMRALANLTAFFDGRDPPDVVS
ncbi:MAG: 2-hydroxyacid dehydrogenase [Gemmatimonadaceae bacterium]